METNNTLVGEPVLPTIPGAEFPIYNHPPVSPHPVFKTDRVQTIDIIRGVALLGILMMNIPIFSSDYSRIDAILRGPHNTTDFITIQTVEAFFGGTMRALFSMLFGAGMILFTISKKETHGGVTVAEYYYRRLLLLVLFGVINAYVFLWEGDILYYYGLCGMLLYPFRKAGAKWLFVLGILCIGIGHLKGMLQYNDLREKRAAYVSAIATEKNKKKLTDKEQEAKGTWLEIEKNQKPDTFRTNRNIREMQGSYPTVFSHLLHRNSDSETWGMYHGMWDMISMMFIGMALFVLGFFSNKLSGSTYRMTLLLGYGLGIPIGWIFFKEGYVGSLELGRYVDAWRVPHWALYDLRRFLLAVGHASVILLIYRSGAIKWLMKALANVGQMAFTNYLMQSIICTIFFFGYGFNYYNKLPYHRIYFVVAAIWVFQIIFSVIWLHYFRFGPFEWVWRSLTYWKKQPMKISKNEMTI
ncbi:MAG: DUF418 domain-containing protein [Bacteroidota bacterium]